MYPDPAAVIRSPRQLDPTLASSSPWSGHWVTLNLGGLSTCRLDLQERYLTTLIRGSQKAESPAGRKRRAS